MTAAPEPDRGADESETGHGHGRHGLLAMVACCVPMVVLIVLIALKVI